MKNNGKNGVFVMVLMVCAFGLSLVSCDGDHDEVVILEQQYGGYHSSYFVNSMDISFNYDQDTYDVLIELASDTATTVRDIEAYNSYTYHISCWLTIEGSSAILAVNEYTSGESTKVQTVSSCEMTFSEGATYGDYVVNADGIYRNGELWLAMSGLTYRMRQQIGEDKYIDRNETILDTTATGTFTSKSSPLTLTSSDGYTFTCTFSDDGSEITVSETSPEVRNLGTFS